MQKHTKIYMSYFDFGEEDFIPCEFPHHLPSNDIHHINGRGKGKDIIENLMALCRTHHEMCELEHISKEEVQQIHNKYLKEFHAKNEKDSRENNYFK